MARKGQVDRGLYARKKGKVTIWYVRLQHEGRRREFGPFDTKTDARNFYQESKRAQRLGQFFPEQYQRRKSEKMNVLLDDYLKTTIAKRAAKRERDFHRWWKNRHGERTAHGLTAKLLEDDRLAMHEEGKSFATINRYTDWLRHVFNWSIEQKRLPSGFQNPVSQIERYPEDETPIEDYTLEQEGRLVANLTEEEVDMVRFAVLSGLRQDEQFKIAKEYCDLSRGVVIIPKTKTRKARTLQLSEEERQILARQIDRHTHSPWVWPGVRHVQRRPLNPRWWYTKRFLPACQSAGIPTPPRAQMWHRLRHTFGTRLAELGHQEAEIQKKGGWTTTVAARRYVHVRDERLRSMGEGLSAMRPILPAEIQTGTGSKMATLKQAVERPSISD